MHNQNRWTGIVVGVVLGVLFWGPSSGRGSWSRSLGRQRPVHRCTPWIRSITASTMAWNSPKMTTFSEPLNGPGGTMHRLDVIYDLIGSALRYPDRADFDRSHKSSAGRFRRRPSKRGSLAEPSVYR